MSLNESSLLVFSKMASQDVKYISFQLKNQLRLFVGERSKVVFDSGCKIFDVHLMENASVTKHKRFILT